MTNPNLRTRLLAATCSGVCLVTAYSLLNPAIGRRQVTPFVFPNSVPLRNWQLTGIEALRDQSKNTSQAFEVVQSGQHYRYVKAGIPLDVEMRYVVGTLGDVSQYLEQQTALPRKVWRHLDSQPHKGIGFHSLFVYKDRAYLSTCINPRGGSTVSTAQFLQNRRTYDLKLSRLLPWFLGQESLRDCRCLWAHLSTPLKGTKPEVAYHRLELAWADWYEWWQPRFPSY